MTHPKMADLVDKLYAATFAELPVWAETAHVNAFQTSLAQYALVIASLPRKNGAPDEKDYTLDILTQTGRFVERINALTYGQMKGDDTRGYEVLGRIYDRARRKALCIDEAIDELLAGLDALIENEIAKTAFVDQRAARVEPVTVA